MEQNPDEFSWLLDILREAKSRSILEVGSRRCDALRAMVEVCPPGSAAYSIDIAKHERADPNLEALRNAGYVAEQYIGDSRLPEAVAWAQTRAPFDFIFIDGDHSTEAVTQDWENYSPMSKLVGFHDISGVGEGVRPLWASIKETHQTREMVKVPGAMGIGIVDK